MATITNAINAGSASAGGIDFYVRNADMVSNNGWTFQVSPDAGTTWNTRLSESFSAASATAMGMAQLSYEESAQSLERIDGLVEEIGNQTELKDSIDLNTRTVDVLIPAEDGGYVLLGLRRPLPAVLRTLPRTVRELVLVR